jgi:hypothetical protein
MRQQVRVCRGWAQDVRALVLALFLLPAGNACASRAAPEASAPAAQAATPPSAAGHIARKQVVETTLTLSAAHPRDARAKLERTLAELGGFVQRLEAQGVAADLSYHFVVRVPEAKLGAMLAAVRTLGSVHSETQEVKDVTREYIDVDARLRNLQRTEQRLLGLLSERSAALADVIAVEQELTRVRGEAEQLTAQLRALDHDVALATLTVWIQPAHTAVAMPDDAFAPVRNLWADAGSVLASSAASLLWAVTFGLRGLLALVPWLPVLALLGVCLGKLRARVRPRRS